MCTLTSGQILGQEQLVRDMYDAGMRSVRINTAHLGGVDELDLLASRLKAMLPDVRILIDTKGPEMRTTAIETKDGEQPALLDLTEGQQITIVGDAEERPSTAEVIRVNYADIHRYVAPGSVLLIDDGRLALSVESVGGHPDLTGRGRPSPQTVGGYPVEGVRARVVRGGELGAKKGIAIQGVDVPLPAVSQRDYEYISYASVSPYVYEIAHSFVRSAEDVLAVREALVERKPIIAKIENQQGLDNLAEIVAIADGVLIARGDLTASLGPEAVPEAQRRIAYVAKGIGTTGRGRPSPQAVGDMPLYLATNILPSMMQSDTPSAADIVGVHTALVQGVDVLLLTNETASGPRPLATVETLSEIICSRQ